MLDSLKDSIAVSACSESNFSTIDFYIPSAYQATLFPLVIAVEAKIRT